MAVTALLLSIAVLFLINLRTGSVNIPEKDVWAALMGNDIRPTWKFIVIESRLPQAITAIICGGSLASCGLLLQAVFHNPLVDTSVLGISSGAGLGVALVTMITGVSLNVLSTSFGGFAMTMIAALIGALAVTAIMLWISSRIQNSILVLIVGIMVSYVASSVVMILSALASEDGLRTFVMWGMGSFSNVTNEHLPWLLIVQLMGMAAMMFMAKSLNVWMLGDLYAESLGLQTRFLRNALLTIVGILSAVTTAFCGPVAFVGLAVPHIARMIVGSDDFRKLLPLTILTGSIIALVCNIACNLPVGGGIIPLNAITPLIGAPVVVYVIMIKNKLLN